MNRVKSSDWPNTVKGVIYQEIGGYYQFTPVVNGWIDKPAESEGIKAAKEAMSGVDPTNGAQFYYDDKVTNQWILAKPVSVQFGHMIFAF
jgi:spore germination cell wall hydrolase CwlJ-like protein